MRNKKLDRVIKKMYFSNDLRAELRENPSKVAEQFDLSQAELQAVQSGDANTLVAVGMDPRLVTDATPTVFDKMKLQTQRVLAFGLAVASMFMFVPFAQAGGRLAPRIGRRVGHRTGRRVSARYVLGRVRAQVRARAGEAVFARQALRRVRARMNERGGRGKLKRHESLLQTDSTFSLQDPIK